MERGIKKVNGVYVPDTETHMTEFLKRESIMGYGVYQLHKLQRAVSYCRKFRRVIDVGAHVGTWSMHFSNIFGHVEAFEPHPLHAECFDLNVDKMRLNTRLWPFALGDVHADDVLLSAGIESTGDTWIAPYGEMIEGREYVTVDMRMIDEFEFVNVDLMKIDCEGFELNVLKGASQTIEMFSPVIIIEQKPTHGAKYGISDTAGCDWLIKQGYVLEQEIVGDYIFTRF